LQRLLENLLHASFRPENTVKPCDEFTDMLTAKLVVLQPHSFVAVQQAVYLKELKLDLQVGLGIVLCDFAENCFVSKR
jgi:hypothetical protein